MTAPMTDAPLPFGPLLRQFRRAAGLTQEALAERSGLSVRAIRALETGERQTPYPHTLGQLARALRLSATDRARLSAAVAPRVGPARPVETRPAPALPMALTTLVGRDRDLGELRRLLGETRLLTLTGAGGVGKTRLALEVARIVASDFPDGAWVAELAPLADPALAPQVVAGALGLVDQPGRPVLDRLLAALQERRLLLVLDNCEHLIEASALLAVTLLRGCPGVKVLATSREPLGLPGETVWRVPSLAPPDPARLPPLQALQQVAAVRLFIERARAAWPDFALTESNALVVAQICTRLDGIPLALELAATRVRALSIEEVATRLSDHVLGLTGGSRTALPRQQTLRATIDWSYALVTEPERFVFRRLAVFAGGWTLAAAEAVCAGLETPDLLEMLTGLVDKSLVLADGMPSGAWRYRLLEPVRQYAWEKLTELGEDGALRERHAAWCLRLTDQAERALFGSEQIAWLDRLDAEHDNLRVALAWCAEHAPQMGLRMAADLVQYWRVRCHYGEGRHWLERLLDRAPAPTAARAEALLGAGIVAYFGQGDAVTGRDRCEAGLALARELGDQRLIRRGLAVFGRLLFYFGDYARAQDLLEEAHSASDIAGDAYAYGTDLLVLSYLSEAVGDYPRARALAAESLAVLRGTGDAWLVSNALDVLVYVALAEGERAQAEAWLVEALRAAQRLSTPRMVADVEELAGRVALWRGDLAAAAAHFEASLNSVRESEDGYRAAWALAGLGQVARRQGEAARAIELLQQSLALSTAQGYRRGIGVALHQLGRAAWGQGNRERAWAHLRASLALRWELGERPGVVEDLEGLAAVAAGTDQLDRAARLLGAADALRRLLGAPLPPVAQPDHEVTVAKTRAALGEPAFTAAMAAGQAMPVDDAVALALADDGSTDEL